MTAMHDLQNLPQSIAVNMKRRRVELGLSLQSIGERAGMSKSGIWELEQGRNPNPTIKTVLALTHALSMPLNSLLGIDASQPLMTEQELALVAAHRSIFAMPPRDNRDRDALNDRG